MAKSIKLQQLPDYGCSWLRQAIAGLRSLTAYKLSIGQKIGCGYGVALGIVLLGTGSGLIIGNSYFQTARTELLLAQQESLLISSCQGKLLEIKSREQELLIAAEEPQKLQAIAADLLTHLIEIEAIILDLHQLSQTSTIKNIEYIPEEYKSILTRYFRNLKGLIAQISPISTQPESLPQVQQLILQFHRSSTTTEFSYLSHELNQISQKFQQRQQQADKAQADAATITAYIILGSMLLSTAVAGMIAKYTTRAIVYPIRTLTSITQAATQTTNLDLQASITTPDEIGELNAALNQLITQVKHLLAVQQAEAHTQLIQNEKMSSLGQMLAGIAHDINNPINFISANLIHARQYFDELLSLLQAYESGLSIIPPGVADKAAEIDLDFVVDDLPKLLVSLDTGASRIRELVSSIKDFSRLDEGKLETVDLHACLESTLLLLNHRLKYIKDIHVIRNYGNIPLISGYSGSLYQVFMNLISNAIDAVKEKSACTPNFIPEISIVTEQLDNYFVSIYIRDNGAGITTEHQAKIFEKFFTTKPRGVGTGLGLAISQQIIVEKHQGKLDCHSQIDRGTEFAIALPIIQPAITPTKSSHAVSTSISAA